MQSVPTNQGVHEYYYGLSDQQWYHGLLPREDIRVMLKHDGDFLVRTTEPVAGDKRQYVLSVMANQQLEEAGIKHFVIKEAMSKFIIETTAFESVTQLINHYLSNQHSITKLASVRLKRAVPRQPWEKAHSDVELQKKLGEGAFGEVHSGRIVVDGRSVKVAVKLAKLETLTKDQVKQIMREARLMRRFNHPNVVRFYGVAAGQEPLMVIMELAECGALDSYLKRQNPHLGIVKKTEMILQAACGLEYLHECSIIHRDIASRNCLYGGGQVKISDFGLSREGAVYQMPPYKKVPIRWLAPETLKTLIYTQKTDVFSYGILCWEVYADGSEPYPGISVAQVLAQVKEGYRMTFPPEVPPQITKFIVVGLQRKCWCDAAEERAKMCDVVKHLRKNALSEGEVFTTNDDYFAVKSLKARIPSKTSVEVVRGRGSKSRENLSREDEHRKSKKATSKTMITKIKSVNKTTVNSLLRRQKKEKPKVTKSSEKDEETED